jgi:hypothetical protein
VFGPIMESSRLSLSLSLSLSIYIYIYIYIYSPGLPGSEVNDAQVSSWRGYFVISWLGGDSFPRGMMRWTG